MANEIKTIADLQAELEGMKTALEAKQKETAEATFDEKIKAINDAIEELKNAKPETTAEDLNGIKEELNGALRAIAILSTRVKESGGTQKPESKKSFADDLGEQLEKRKSDLQNYTKNERRPLGFEIKAVGNMGSSSLTESGSNSWVGANQIGGVGRKPYENIHLRNIIPVIPFGSDTAFVVRDAAGEGGPTRVAMAAAKPQSDRDYVKLYQPVNKIAHYFKVPEEMLSDISWLQNEIVAVGLEDLLAKEDDLILNQTGAGLFSGLTTATNSTAYSTPASLALAIDQANNYDVLVAAWTQLRNLNNTANYVLCHPSDYARMILTKATTGEYAFGAPNMQIPNIFGIPLVPHTAITSDKFLLGDFSKAKIGERAGVSVRFYDQNEDDAIKNMVTIVIEERIVLAVDRADRIIYGDFSDARAALETA